MKPSTSETASLAPAMAVVLLAARVALAMAAVLAARMTAHPKRVSPAQDRGRIADNGGAEAFGVHDVGQDRNAALLRVGILGDRVGGREEEDAEQHDHVGHRIRRPLGDHAPVLRGTGCGEAGWV